MNKQDRKLIKELTKSSPINITNCNFESRNKLKFEAIEQIAMALAKNADSLSVLAQAVLSTDDGSMIRITQ